METKQSSFQFIDFLIEKSVIKRKPVKKKDNISIDIKPTGIYYKENNKFQLNLDVILTTASERVYAEVRAIGLFLISNDKSKDVDDFFCLNAPAILFPHVRAYLYALTSLSGMGTVVIPTLNLTHLKDPLREAIEYK